MPPTAAPHSPSQAAPGRLKAYYIYGTDPDRTFLGVVRGVTNERQARRTFAAEAEALGYPVRLDELFPRYDAYGMERTSLLDSWYADNRLYTYTPTNRNVDLADGYFDLVRRRYSTVDETHYVGGSDFRSR